MTLGSMFEWALRDVALTVVPERHLERLRAYRRTPSFRQAGVVFIHVPKAAGTSITDALYHRFIGHFKVSDVLSACPTDVIALPRFSVTRNPWDRLVSAWAFARAPRDRPRSRQVRIRQPWRYASPQFADFTTFVHEWLAAQTIETLDGVFRPQHRYLTDEKGKLAFDHIGRVEALALTEEWLSDALHRQVRFERLNTTSHRSYDSYYDARTYQLVGELYEADVRLFGYG